MYLKLKWICENARKDRIWNEEIQLKIGVGPIDEMMKPNCLRWFGHMQKRVINALVNKRNLIKDERTKRGKERPKITHRNIKKWPVNYGGDRVCFWKE